MRVILAASNSPNSKMLLRLDLFLLSWIESYGDIPLIAWIGQSAISFI